MNFDEAIAEGFRRAVEQGLPNYQIWYHGKPFGIVSFAKRKYYIHRIPSVHFFRKFQGYGVSRSILEQLRLYGIETVSLFEVGKTGTRRYGIRVERFFNRKPLLEHRNEIEPKESQLFCRLDEFVPETGRWKESDITQKIEPDVVNATPE